MKTKKERVREKREIIRNKKLCKKYPWLIPWKCWRGDKEVYGWRKPWKKYSYIMWDFWPHGWNKSFGDLLLDDLDVAVKKTGIQDTFHIYDGKEKWGRLVLDCSPYNSEIDKVINKYIVISENVCVCCGKPDSWLVDDGWISAWCFDCYKKKLSRYKHRKVSDEEAMKIYEKYRCGDSNIISDTYNVTWWNYPICSKEEEMIDIKTTADKIRARYRK